MKNRGLLLLLLLLCLCPLRVAWAQINWVSSSVAPVSANAVSSLSIATPASIVFADLLIAQITVNPGTSAVTAPTGWSFVDEVASGSVRQRIYYRVTNASEPTSFSFGIAPSARAAGAIIALRGAEMVPPIFASYSERSDTGNALIADSVNSTRNNSLLLSFFSQANGNGSITPTSPLTSRLATATGSGQNGVSIAVGSESLALAGPAGSRSASSTQNTDYVSQVIALRPAVSTCITDDFQRAQLGSNWAVTTRQGTFTPAIVNNRMRMTEAADYQSTAATLQYVLPASGNLVTTEFRHFAYGGNGADGLVFVLSDASITPQPGGYGGSLGYAQRSGVSGFAGGWLGVGLDEYGNYSNGDEGRTGRPPSWTTPNGINPSTGTRRDAVVVRGSLPNYYYLAGTNTLTPQVDNTPAQGYLYRVTVDSRVSGEAWVLVERDTGSGYAALIPRFNVLAANSAQQDATGASRVPSNFYLSFTGSTGAARNIHEYDNFSACALALDAVNPQIDHFRFYHDGAANTCTAEPIRLQACANSDCSSLYTGGVTAQLAVSGSGQWQDSAGNALTNNTVSFSGGSVNLRLSQTSAITQTLSVSSSIPVTRPLSVPMCLNSATNTAYPNCNLVFSGTTSFTFGTAPANVIPAQEAGVESANIRIQANNSACTGTPPADFNNKTVAVQFWFNYLDPQASTVATNITGYKPALWIDPYEAASNITPMFFELPTAKASAVIRSVYFNSSGIGYFKMVYPDVGQLQLSAEVSSLSITGNAAFVVKPYEFLVDNVLRTADSFANPAATGASGSVFIQAGQDFSARITARNAAHKITDNSGITPVTPLGTFTSYGRTTRLFGKEAVPEGVRLLSDAAALLPSGGNNPAIGNRDIVGGSFGISSSTLGQATVTNLNWPEVGIIRLQPKIRPTGSETTGDYLGAGDVARYTSPNIGRFIPRGFVASGQSVVPRSDIATCAVSSFTYLGEPFRVSNFTLSATATDGTTTQNYAGNWAKLDLSSADTNVSKLGAGAQHGVSPAFTNFYSATPASNRVVAIYGGSSFTDTYPASDPDCPNAKKLAWCKGSAQTSLDVTINRAAAPDGPFAGAILGLSPVDGDGVKMSSLDFQRDYTGSGALVPDGQIIAVLAGNELRFGRLRMISGQGSDAAPFIMKTEAQYWDGAYWRTNMLDSCTSYVKENAACSGLTSVSAATVVNKGYGSLTLTKPSGVGTAKICLNMASTADGCAGATSAASLGYLRGNWGAASYDKDPFGYIEFGRANSNTRGNWGFIYQRENF